MNINQLTILPKFVNTNFYIMDISNILSVISIFVSVMALVIARKSATYTRRQYLSNIAPELWTNVYTHNSIEKTITFDICNRGYTARIIELIPITPNIRLYQQYCPLDIEQNDRKEIVCDFLGRDSINEYVNLTIKYQDKEGNKYRIQFIVDKCVSRLETPKPVDRWYNTIFKKFPNGLIEKVKLNKHLNA